MVLMRLILMVCLHKFPTAVCNGWESNSVLQATTVRPTDKSVAPLVARRHVRSYTYGVSCSCYGTVSMRELRLWRDDYKISICAECCTIIFLFHLECHLGSNTPHWCSHVIAETVWLLSFANMVEVSVLIGVSSQAPDPGIFAYVRMCWWASGHGRACLLLVVQLFASYVWVVRPTWVLVLSSWGSSHVDTCTCPTVFSFRFWCFCFSMRIVTVCDSLSGVFAEWSRNPGRLSYPIPLRRCMGNVVFSGVSELFFCAHSIWCPQRRLSHINLRLLYWSPVGLAWVKIYKPLHHWPCMMLCDFIGSSLNWDVYVCPICPAIHLRRCFVEWMRPLLWVVKVGFLYLGVAGVTIAAKKPIFYQKIRR